MKILIKNGRIINPASGMDKKADILISDGKVEKISENIEESAERTIDATGKWVVPGLIDVHVHLREPGFEYKETIATGSHAAAAGGYTTICCMPNTKPVVDSEIMVEYIKLKAQREAVVNVLPIGAITKGQKGEELAEIGKMAKAGACAISEDGKSVENSGILKTAMSYSKMFDIPVFSHCEDKDLVAGGCMNYSAQSQIMGLKGISNDSEDVIVARDIILAKSTGARLHICHVSTQGAVDLIRYAKSQGQNVSAEITPHHFTLDDTAVDSYDANTKMNPPLRSKEDVEAVREALEDGTADIIATDHAPHSSDEKNCEYEKAAFGIVGLETALPLGITVLVDGGYITENQLIEKMSVNPAKLLGIKKGNISEGFDADITIINPDTQYSIDSSTFLSKGKNTPFNGYKVRGKVEMTLVGGKIVFEKGQIK